MSSMPESPNQNIIICNNNTNIDLNLNDNNVFIQLSESTQGLSLKEFLNLVVANVGNNSGIHS